MTFRYIPVIGLEIHVQLSTATKIFCPCSTDYIGAEPNTNVCPVCLGLPGSLPVLNKKAVELGVRAGLALSCTIKNHSVFHRKNYFYPDLPKAYQISQYDLPLAEGGEIFIPGDDGRPRRIRITRLHLEEDAGKLVHSAADGRLEGAAFSFVDYNRGGVPLAEIVSEPDITSPGEAREYVARIRQTMRYLGVSDGDMERGSLRVDANVSVKKTDEATGEVLCWGERTEIKNMNSLRAVERALQYEIRRQTAVLAEGGSLERETRHWNDGEGVTTSMRSKEAADDYRYFPDPDIPPIVVTEELLESTRNALPELPWTKEGRFAEKYGLPETDAAFMAESLPVALYFEECVKSGASPLRAANWIRTEVFRVMNEKGFSMDSFPVKPSALAELVSLVDGGKLSTTVAREVFARLAEGRSFKDALEAAGASPGGLSSEDVEKMVERVLRANGDVVEEIRSGRDPKGKKIKFLAGLVMREARGQADVAAISGILERRLKEDR
ncbi:Asp-tRNA(Asn)/Glu-tRNA(Gln) amidotransferase subunit GatB [Aminivibrio sp.]|jgi:aspartyl-tRNA(Asn)/glutamyl-tRNA(Gln) amidotransferase subunit B|uniref:Asp-tRNA(Asn)/Glu-tRNA(Gln) amidotransferase subunit GatB n=1 Tax=Aminivibrio sp. TaxID=1872489 RepID=UPI001A37F659|nr:Asp-tRNA(Asn)/Glu-tRNA(Gln) amidotransferase subunit GatB [Aminivibrio sp.]MBL3540353.1 Asp-tRNA(Asn)/Glu-tRNA(Gln) amidotransferase subunit GatB [Aminivibrio sp.]MDK2958922.1 aspartyl-tRNA(Asn)/glutamyl-tRNA(Gln) amidotransferase subunit [Synergistaceae bacterium]